MKRQKRLPGFVDLQVNGFRGVDFSGASLDRDGIEDLCSALSAKGTAGFLATVVTAPLAVYDRNLPLIASAMSAGEGKGRILGIHLEGPFISKTHGFVGAHDPRFVRKADCELLTKWQKLANGQIRMLTIAAEIPGACKIVACARKLGIVVSIGHSNFDADQLHAVARSGATTLTHLGNGVPGILPRHPNQVWTGLAADGMSAMVITDGFHVPFDVIKTFIRSKGTGGLVVVSDVSSIAGLKPGRYSCFGSEVLLERSGRISNKVRGCLAGSGSTMLGCVNRLAQNLPFLSRDELVAMAFTNPLRLAGIPRNRLRGSSRLLYNPAQCSFEMNNP